MKGKDQRTGGRGVRPEGGYQPEESRQGAPPQGGSVLAPAPPVQVEGPVQATVTQAAPEAPPRPRPKVFRCYGEDPGLTREATPEQIAEWGGAPFCPACGCRMGEDLTGRA